MTPKINDDCPTCQAPIMRHKSLIERSRDSLAHWLVIHMPWSHRQPFERVMWWLLPYAGGAAFGCNCRNASRGTCWPECGVVGEENPVVGWGTTTDGKHVAIRKDFADALWQSVEDEKAKRASDMPTERDAIYALNAAIRRLKELGWQDPVYAPKDGSQLDLIEPGSAGIHQGHYEGKWPNGSWCIYDAGDLWPSRPVLARPSKEPHP